MCNYFYINANTGNNETMHYMFISFFRLNIFYIFYINNLISEFLFSFISTSLLYKSLLNYIISKMLLKNAMVSGIKISQIIISEFHELHYYHTKHKFTNTYKNET